MHYPTIQNVETIIRQLNHTHGAKITITNRGQLEFALKKPQMILYGNERYPELHQKAAALMETMTKAHALSDGNKRVAMMTAKTMIEINGGRLVLPLKSIRLAVNTAMDSDDKISEIIHQWFKVHTATDSCSLCSMLLELDEEEDVVKSLLDQGREDDADRLLDNWMAFTNYPDNKKACSDMILSWKKTRKDYESSHMGNNGVARWRREWIKLMDSKNLPYGHTELPSHRSMGLNDLRYNHNSMAELQDAEERIRAEVVKCDKSTDTAFVLQNALRLERYGMYDCAIGMFERLWDLNKDDLHAVYHIATIKLHGMNDPESALKYFEEYLGHHPDEFGANLQTGMALAELGRYQDALDHFANLSGEDVDIHKGMVYDKMQEYDKAIKLYKNAILANPNNAHVYGLMGVSYTNAGEYPQALECFDKTIEIQKDYQGYYNKGLVLQRMDRNKEAIHNYTAALDENPRHLESRINLGSALSDSGRPEEAMPHLLAALDVEPGHLVALHSLAITLARTGRYQEALGYADKMTNLHPSDSDAKYLKAKILAEIGRVEDVLNILMPLAKSDPMSINSDKLKEDFESILHDKRFRDWLEGRARGH